MNTYTIVVDETLVQTATYIVEANSEAEARVKARAGDTESQDIDPYSTELVSRQIRSVEVED